MTKWLAVGMTDHRPCLPKVVKFGVEIIRIIPNRPYFSGRLCTSFAAYSLLSKVPWVWYVLLFFLCSFSASSVVIVLVILVWRCVFNHIDYID